MARKRKPCSACRTASPAQAGRPAGRLPDDPARFRGAVGVRRRRRCGLGGGAGRVCAQVAPALPRRRRRRWPPPPAAVAAAAADAPTRRRREGRVPLGEGEGEGVM